MGEIPCDPVHVRAGADVPVLVVCHAGDDNPIDIGAGGQIPRGVEGVDGTISECVRDGHRLAVAVELCARDVPKCIPRAGLVAMRVVLERRRVAEGISDRSAVAVRVVDTRDRVPKGVRDRQFVAARIVGACGGVALSVNGGGDIATRVEDMNGGIAHAVADRLRTRTEIVVERHAIAVGINRPHQPPLVIVEHAHGLHSARVGDPGDVPVRIGHRIAIEILAHATVGEAHGGVHGGAGHAVVAKGAHDRQPALVVVGVGDPWHRAGHGNGVSIRVALHTIPGVECGHLPIFSTREGESPGRFAVPVVGLHTRLAKLHHATTHLLDPLEFRIPVGTVRGRHTRPIVLHKFVQQLSLDDVSCSIGHGECVAGELERTPRGAHAPRIPVGCQERQRVEHVGAASLQRRIDPRRRVPLRVVLVLSPTQAVRERGTSAIGQSESDVPAATRAHTVRGTLDIPHKRRLSGQLDIHVAQRPGPAWPELLGTSGIEAVVRADQTHRNPRDRHNQILLREAELTDFQLAVECNAHRVLRHVRAAAHRQPQIVHATAHESQIQLAKRATFRHARCIPTACIRTGCQVAQNTTIEPQQIQPPGHLVFGVRVLRTAHDLEQTLVQRHGHGIARLIKGVRER